MSVCLTGGEEGRRRRKKGEGIGEGDGERDSVVVLEPYTTRAY